MFADATSEEHRERIVWVLLPRLQDFIRVLGRLLKRKYPQAGRCCSLLTQRGADRQDHAIPVIGYDDRGADGLWYGMHTTWSEDETVVWEPFRGSNKGRRGASPPQRS